MLLSRRRRARILEKAGLDKYIDLDKPQQHIGDIVRGAVKYEWGHVVFQSRVEGVLEYVPCSVYAAFERLITEHFVFPTFITLSDVQNPETVMQGSLPVFGQAFNMEGLSALEQQQVLYKMQRLHGLVKRQAPLVSDVVEITDEDVFKEYFSEDARKARELSSQAPAEEMPEKEDEAGYDNLRL